MKKWYKLDNVGKFYASTANNSEWTLELIKTLEDIMPAKMEISSAAVNERIALNDRYSISPCPGMSHPSSHSKR